MSTNRTTPNPINTDKYHADKVGQCVRPRTCSVDPARRRHYGKSRAARFSRLLSDPARFASIPFFNS